MLPHLANPWILARMSVGACATALAIVAAFAAVRILARYRVDGPPDERTLALERSAELVATALTAAFTLEIVAALLTVLASDRLAGSVRGAMCAYGVFGSTPWGATASRSSIAAAAVCALWLGMRRVDVRLRRGSIVRVLAGVALVATAAIGWDLVASGAYFAGLDLDVVATCCSVFVDSTRAGNAADTSTLWATREIAVAAGVVLAAIALAVRVSTRVSRSGGFALAGFGLMAAWSALRAATDVVAPFVYESPSHRCPYCLLHADAAPAGPVLLIAIAAGFLVACATVGAAGIAASRAGARAAANDVIRGFARASVVAWGTVALAAIWPVARYAWTTGTLRLGG